MTVQRVRKGDVERILDAARKSGFPPRRIRVLAGGFEVIFDDDPRANGAPNPWDEDLPQ